VSARRTRAQRMDGLRYEQLLVNMKDTYSGATLFEGPPGPNNPNWLRNEVATLVDERDVDGLVRLVEQYAATAKDLQRQLWQNIEAERVRLNAGLKQSRAAAKNARLGANPKKAEAVRRCQALVAAGLSATSAAMRVQHELSVPWSTVARWEREARQK
jgi:replication initiation and membrane attachment protein DnaB